MKSPPDVVRRIASLADGPVRVVVPGTFEVNAKDAEAAKTVDEQLRATVAIVAALAATVQEQQQRVAEAIGALKQAADSVHEHQEALGKAMERIEKAMAQDVAPIYDTAGKLIGAKRVPGIEK